MRLIGIGSAGANIVKQFDHYDVYDLTYVDEEHHDFDKGTVIQKPTEKPYHEAYDQLDYDWAGLEGDSKEIQLFVCGASDVSGVVLQVLQHLNSVGCEIEVFFIMPDYKFLSHIEKLQNRVTFGVLQEYARSGLLKNILIFDNNILGKMIGNVAISNYYNKINDHICRTVHMLNYCTKNKPIFGNKGEFLETTRIGCVGYGLLEEDINLFYDLKWQSDDKEIVYPLEIQYNFFVPKEKIDNDVNLMTTILETVEKREEQYKTISYGVFENDAEQDDVTVLVWLHTSKVQDTKHKTQ